MPKKKKFSRVALLTCDKLDFRAKKINKGKRRCYIMIKINSPRKLMIRSV